MNDFYVGYLPYPQPGLRRFLAVIIAILIGVAAIIAILLVFGQMPFPGSHFGYLRYHEYDGVILESPQPMLLTSRGRFLLVAPGKHGAGDLVRGMNLRGVRLSASLIERSGNRMLEVVPGSVLVAGAGAGTLPDPPMQLGSVTLTGEIVDSKCYLGVMNPGSGKVHRSCAARCISGGIPPAFLVRDASGATRILLLSGPQGQPLQRRILDFAAEPIKITGQLSRADDFLTLEIDPSTIQRRE
jgi:hypothetical protein